MRPSRRPARMSGAAEGSEIFQIAAASRDRPSARATSLEARLDGGEAVHGREQHRPDRAEADDAERHRRSMRPKIAIATGMTAEAGRGRRNSSVGPIYSRAALEEPISAPSATPDDRGDQPAAEHVLDRAHQLGAEVLVQRGRVHSAVQARAGVGRNTGETSLQRGDLAPEADESRRARRGPPGARRSAFIAPPPAAPRGRTGALCANTSAGVEAVADDADPDEIGEHQFGPQRLARRHHAVAETDRIDGDLDGHGDDQRNARREPERDEDARQRGRRDDLDDPRRRATASARARPRSGAARRPRTAARVSISSGHTQAKATMAISSR